MLPAITPYYVMRVGTLPLVPYHRPGDRALADAVGSVMGAHSAALLANHGSVVAGASLDEAVYAAEELEETAKLFFVLRGCATRYLTAGQIAELHRVFPRVCPFGAHSYVAVYRTGTARPEVVGVTEFDLRFDL